MLNLERHLPASGLDDAYIMCIRQANLDAMGGRAASTIGAHAMAVKHIMQNCSLIQKTPTLMARTPMPLSDPVGMGMAVDILFNSLAARP
jgi:hypothetical protein